jgi:hypothetical protein
MADIGKEGLKALEKAKRFGNRAIFEFFLELFHDQLVEQFKEYLNGYTPETLKDMVMHEQFPYFDPSVFRALHGFESYLERIKAKRLYEALAEARPDLAETLWEMGDPHLPPEQKPGMLYIVKFRRHLLQRIMTGGEGPEMVADLSTKPASDMVSAKCDKCGRSWPVPREEFDNIKACPFCGHGKDETIVTPPPTPQPEIPPPEE